MLEVKKFNSKIFNSHNRNNANNDEVVKGNGSKSSNNNFIKKQPEIFF